MTQAAARRVERRSADPLLGLPAPPPEALATGRRALRRYVAALAVVDLGAVVTAVGVAYLARYGPVLAVTNGYDYGLILLGTVLAWLGALLWQGGYETRVLGVGAEEYRRVTRATFVVVAVVATASFMLKADVARLFVGVAFPLGFVLLLLGRFAARQWLVRQRRAGRLGHRVVVVGDRQSVVSFVARLRREPYAGFGVVGACLPARYEGLRDADEVPSLGSYDDVAAAVRAVGADVVAVTPSETITPERLRQLAWALEGADVDLVVAPAMTDVAGPRVTVRPVAGLPLLYVDEPRFTGPQRLVKGTLDWVVALFGLVLLSPLLLAAGLAVRLGSPGPALFRQVRVGREGRLFRVCKLRTMYVDAEQRLESLRTANEADGLLFKIKDDPRITPVGRLLRRTSVDELPQLLNVLRGQMSLVGPRPLPVQGDAFVGPEQRRHLVKPGITGLWQVSGRAEQSWEDAVRLDLYYVENWSLSMDLVILLRTVLAVFRGS
ncbi:MAG TPA: sugar transferase [Actinomycetes bacterium]